MSEQIKIGTKVRTAAVLERDKWVPAVERCRRPNALGEVYGFTSDAPKAAATVVHEDGTRAPYFRDEIAPIPDEKAAPTTPIGRLRATICDVTGASLFYDQWEKIDVALREVEGAMLVDANALRLARAEVEMLKGQIFNRALMAGEVGPMPVRHKAAPGEVVRDPDGHEVGPAAWDPIGGRPVIEHPAWMAPPPEPVKAARPRVGGWVDVGGIPTVFDDRGACVATTWRAGDKGHGWIANRPFDTAARSFEATPAEAKAAALAVLATWADVEGQPEAVKRSNPDAARLAAVHERIAAMPREQQHEAARRASVSYSDERTAVERGARIDGDEIVWPDGERYPRRTVEAVKPEGPRDPVEEAPKAWIPLLPHSHAGASWANLTRSDQRTIAALYPEWVEGQFAAARWVMRTCSGMRPIDGGWTSCGGSLPCPDHPAER